jgi:hypothetical protein
MPQGPALLVYYAPALVQKAGPSQVCHALSVLAEVLAAARKLFPLDSNSCERTACVRIDALKVLTPEEIEDARPWRLQRTTPSDAEAARGPPDGAEAVAMEPLTATIHETADDIPRIPIAIERAGSEVSSELWFCQGCLGHSSTL